MKYQPLGFKRVPARAVGACLHAYGKERNGAPQHDAVKYAFKSAARGLRILTTSPGFSQ
jgi:hypothetical protein